MKHFLLNFIICFLAFVVALGVSLGVAVFCWYFYGFNWVDVFALLFIPFGYWLIVISSYNYSYTNGRLLKSKTSRSLHGRSMWLAFAIWTIFSVVLFAL